MNINFLLKGFIVGLAVALPVEPTSILCIHRALAEGFSSGIVSSLGAATSHVVYAYIGAFELMFISSILVSQQVWLLFIRGVFLCYLGLKRQHVYTLIWYRIYLF